MRRAGSMRIAINEAALVVPNCSVCLALDTPVLESLLTRLDRDVWVWQSPRAPVKLKSYRRYVWGDEVKSGEESLPIAIRIATHFGFTKGHFIGCDAMSYSREEHQREGVPYAESILQHHAGKRTNYNYGPIVRNIWKALEETGMVPVWEHTTRTLVNPRLRVAS